MYFRDCKTLSVFERKIPLTLEFYGSKVMPSFSEAGDGSMHVK
jgi:hypothetical protein